MVSTECGDLKRMNSDHQWVSKCFKIRLWWQLQKLMSITKNTELEILNGQIICELHLNKPVKEKKKTLSMPHYIAHWQIKQAYVSKNYRTILYKTLLPPVLISTSVESLSKLPALLTIFIKWIAVQAKGMRYFPSLWQNWSAWLFSFSNFSLFCKTKLYTLYGYAQKKWIKGYIIIYKGKYKG